LPGRKEARLKEAGSLLHAVRLEVATTPGLQGVLLHQGKNGKKCLASGDSAALGPHCDLHA